MDGLFELVGDCFGRVYAQQVAMPKYFSKTETSRRFDSAFRINIWEFQDKKGERNQGMRSKSADAT